MRRTINRWSGGLAALLLSAAVLPVLFSKGQGFRSGVAFYVLVILFVLALLAWVFSLDFIARRMPFVWRGFGHGLTVDWEAQPQRWDVLTITKQGRSLKNASLQITGTPIFERFVEGGKHSRNGTIWEDGKRIGWNENGLKIAGGGHPTKFGFAAHLPPGTTTLVIRIYDDELGSAVEMPVDVYVAPKTIDPEQARNRLDVLLTQLGANRRIITRSLRYGWWYNPGAEQSYTAAQDGGRSYREYVGDDTVTAISEAKADAHAFLTAYKDFPHQAPLDAACGIERAWTSTVFAQIKVESERARWAEA